MTTLVLVLSLFLVLLPWALLFVLWANRAVEVYREWSRTGREMDPLDLGMLRLGYVTLMVAIWLGGW